MDLLNDPENFVQCIMRTTGSMGSTMTYGFRLPNAESQLAKDMGSNSHGFFQLVVGSAYLDWFPSLRPLFRLLPRALNPIAKKAHPAYKREAANFQTWYQMAIGEQARTIDLPCEFYGIWMGQG